MSGERPDRVKGADGALHTSHVEKPLSDEVADEDWDLSEIRDGRGFDVYETEDDGDSE